MTDWQREQRKTKAKEALVAAVGVSLVILTLAWIYALTVLTYLSPTP